MPRREDIKKILVLGSGPIVIGQAAEFDYSGAQACKVLLEEGYEVVLVNSNPATIMTDPEFATATYIEPLLPASVARVIDRERPDALLPTLGGGTALNLARALTDDGTLARYRVELLGADYDVIRRAEDRDLFRATMERTGLRVPRSAAVKSMREAERALPEVGLPAIVRPGFTMGGAGGGIARSEPEYRQRRRERRATLRVVERLREGELRREMTEHADRCRQRRIGHFFDRAPEKLERVERDDDRLLDGAAAPGGTVLEERVDREIDELVFAQGVRPGQTWNVAPATKPAADRCRMAATA